MARKFGKKKQVNLNPLAYNIGIAGTSGVGKTTLAKNVCEKLVGEDGYIMLDIGRESGHDCIEGIVSETVPDWDMMEEIIDDIIDNRTTDYKDLKVVVFDTLDEMFNIAEEETIAEWNRNNPDKIAKSINGVNGGFGKGMDACIEKVLGCIWRLKKVGIDFMVIVHTKVKDVEDPITGMTYQIITANMTQRYFNAVKTKLDILGVAYIDRNIITEKLGRKDIKGKEITRNVVAKEARKISFRSDDFNMDSKSRFPNIVPEIELDANQFIEAIQNAIRAEQGKSAESYEEREKRQKKEEAAKMKQVDSELSKKREEKEINEIMETVLAFIKANINTNPNAVREIVTKSKELGFDNPTLVDDLESAKALKELIK